ncbi:putative HTH-type transcriptional regulator YdfH [Pseudomonas sp. 24 E 1]|nr:putative HTH-type transcriptional regulator YdfH [Pseudomonas sp. 24 E 1]
MKSRSVSIYDILRASAVSADQARDVIMRRLRNAIFDGELAPGVPIRTQTIASLYGVSRTPVREALRQLEVKGLVIIAPHRGAVVASVSRNAIEAHLLRSILEPRVLRISLPFLTTANLESADDMLVKMKHEDDVSVRYALYCGFFESLYKEADNRRLLRVTLAGLADSEWLFRYQIKTANVESSLYKDCVDILGAVRNCDNDYAVELLLQHLGRSQVAVESFLYDNDFI